LLTDLDIDGLDAVGKHYRLLAAIMRLICATVLSRGPQNEQTLEQGRTFLSENRLSILAVLKKSAGLGSGAELPEPSIDELAESFMLLISVTGFLDVSLHPY
jgi:nuclear pore complex protein Nup205